MQLNLNDEYQIKDSTVEDLRDRLPKLGIEQFCILAQSDEHYMQCFQNEDGSYLLEYRNGSADQHFSIESDILSAADVLNAFIGYRERDPIRWQANHHWTQVPFDEDFAGDSFHTHYVLNGEEMARIRVGSGNSTAATPGSACFECDAADGDFHVEDCTAEECPSCHGLLQRCDCL